ncbi:MAG: GNAT family N-acetyltransferase, partial [Gammaproteobacteria bacterium]
LQRQANQDMKRRVSRVFVARVPENKSRVLSFYTLSAISIDLSALPEKVAKKLPKHQVPAALIGRLAVDLVAQNMGTGRMLLADAVKRTIAVSDDIAIYAMVVDAINQQAESVYTRYGFAPLARGSGRLFLPLKSL